MNPQLTRREALGVLGALALPFDNLLGQTDPVPLPSTGGGPQAGLPPPDLATLDPLMQWIAREQPPRMSFLDPQWTSLDAWKAAARPVFHQHLSYSPEALPLEADVVSREERDGFTVEEVRIRATSAYEIPVWVLVPSGPKRRRPAVVAAHCHSGRFVWGHEKILSSPGEPAVVTEFRHSTYGRPWAEALARRGYVVLVTDAFYFGARRLRVEQIDPDRIQSEVRGHYETVMSAAPNSSEWVHAYNRVCGFYEHLTAKTIFAAGATWPGIHVWDDMRIVDYLASRDDVDPGRIGCAGLSGGGIRTAHLIAADARIKAACVVGWMTSFAHQLRNHLRNHTWMVYIPGLYRSLDLPDAAALHAPGALLVQQCLQDRLYPRSGMEGAVDKLAAIYAKAGIPERFRGTYYDEPHSFRPHMQEDAFDWLDHHL